LLLVKKTSRLNFLRLVGGYQKGTLVGKNGKIYPEKYAEIVSCRRIKSVKITGMKQVCTDGEVEEMTSVDISVLPAAISYTYG
jgi:diacylglycerol kinase family enzyme